MTDIDCKVDDKWSALCEEDLDGQSLLYTFSDEEHYINYDYSHSKTGDSAGGKIKSTMYIHVCRNADFLSPFLYQQTFPQLLVIELIF